MYKTAHTLNQICIHITRFYTAGRKEAVIVHFGPPSRLRDSPGTSGPLHLLCRDVWAAASGSATCLLGRPLSFQAVISVRVLPATSTPPATSGPLYRVSYYRLASDVRTTASTPEWCLGHHLGICRLSFGQWSTGHVLPLHPLHQGQLGHSAASATTTSPVTSGPLHPLRRDVWAATSGSAAHLLGQPLVFSGRDLRTCPAAASAPPGAFGLLQPLLCVVVEVQNTGWCTVIKSWIMENMKWRALNLEL